MVKKKNVDDQKMLKNQNREERGFQDRHQERSPNIKSPNINCHNVKSHNEKAQILRSFKT